MPLSAMLFLHIFLCMQAKCNFSALVRYFPSRAMPILVFGLSLPLEAPLTREDTANAPNSGIGGSGTTAWQSCGLTLHFPFLQVPMPKHLWLGFIGLLHGFCHSPELFWAPSFWPLLRCFAGPYSCTRLHLADFCCFLCEVLIGFRLGP